MSFYLNDHSGDPPKLKVYLNLDTLLDLPADGLWPGLSGVEAMKRLAADGFAGVQLTQGEPVPGSSLPHCGLDRVNRPEETDAITARHAARGDLCLTLHVGWGIETDHEVDLLIESVLTAAEKHRLPTFVETHRATVTQDMWRTVEITKRFPEILFNGDFSHYYTGQEMGYGGLDMKLTFMAPIFGRIGFLHGRLASPGHIQVPVPAFNLSAPPENPNVENACKHFNRMWELAWQGFQAHAGAGDVLIFAPELLSSAYDYEACTPFVSRRGKEDRDRYRQALRLKNWIRRICGEIE